MSRRQQVDYEDAGSDYLAQRQLRRGAAGWLLLAGLGVSAVISGDFAGWSFGLAEGGWGGMLIATALSTWSSSACTCTAWARRCG